MNMANRRFIDFPIASSVGDNDIVLIWQDGLNKQTTKGTLIQGAPTSLEGLTDVDIAGLINGQILQYNSVTGKWENVDRTGLNLSELGDVSIVSPSNGQVLVYNSTTSKWENSSAGFVPYVGAVTTVDLGAQGLRAGYVRFNTSVVSVPDEQGIMFWDADDETIDVILNGYIMKIGEDQFYPVKNQTGSSIAKGTAVRFAGTVGASGRLLIAPFIADGSVISSFFMGVTAEAIADGEDGKVLYFGRIRGINTDAFNEGDVLYASTTVAGGFQTAVPVAPNNIVQVAAVINKSINQGVIFIRPSFGSNINQDEGVKITSVANLDLLQYQSGTGLWENKTKAQVLGGTSSQFVKGDGTLDSTAYGTGTVTSVGLSSATSGVTIGSTPITTSGTITLEIATASGSQNGLLSSTDWTTFNGKQNALTNPVTGTGTTNYLPKFTGSTTIGNSLVFDNGTNVGINTTNPLLNLQINSASGSNSTLAFSENNGLKWYTRYNAGDGSYSIVDVVNSATRLIINTSGNLGLGVTPSAWFSAYKVIQVGNTASFFGVGSQAYIGNNTFVNSSDNFAYITSNSATLYRQNTGIHYWYNAPSGTEGNAITFAQAMTLFSSGNLAIGPTSDAGFKLDVNGTGRFSGVLRVMTHYAEYSDAEFMGALGFNRNPATGAIFNNARAAFQLQNNLGTFQFRAFSSAGADLGTPLSIASTGEATFSSLGTGSVIATAGTLSTVSDFTYKIDDGYIDSAIEKVLNLKPRYFYWNEKSGLPKDIRQLGFYAQEVNEALGEEAANTPKDKNIPWGISDRSIIAMLTKAIQELKQEINNLKN
jgi:hypothetical protein